MRHPALIVAPVITAILVALLIAACGDSGEGSKQGVFQELLGTIPDTVETRQWVLINDYALARELFGVELPGPDADQESLEDYLVDLLEPSNSGMSPGPFISGFSDVAFLFLENQPYLAFDLRNVNQSVEAGLPPEQLEVVRGRFDPDATDQALRNCSQCPEPDRIERQGVAFYSWGEDLAVNLEERLSPPAFDKLGRGGRLAVQKDYVYRTVETRGMEKLIDVRLEQRRSLADFDDFQLLVAGLDQLGVYSALLSNQTQDLSDEAILSSLLPIDPTADDFDRLKEEIVHPGLLRPYQAFATATGKDDEGQFMALVLVHDDARAASRNLDLLQRRIDQGNSLRGSTPWREFFNQTEIHTDGRVLLAKLRGDRTNRIWLEFVLFIDPLIGHE